MFQPLAHVSALNSCIRLSSDQHLVINESSLSNKVTDLINRSVFIHSVNRVRNLFPYYNIQGHCKKISSFYKRDRKREEYQSDCTGK